MFNGLADVGAEVQQVVIRPTGSASPLREGFARAIECHVTLRTTIEWKGVDSPRCIQHAGSPVPWEVERHEGRLHDVVSEFLERDRCVPLDLSVLPIMRLTLLQAADGEAVVWTFHHAHLDGRSVELVLHDVLATVAGRPPGELSPDPALHVAAALAPERLEAAREHYAQLLAGLAEPTPLPGVRSAPGDERRMYEHVRDVTPAQMAQIDAYASTFSYTWASAVNAAWAIVLSKYGYTSDVAFGVTRACRHVVPSSAATVGCLINTVPVRIQLDPNERMVDLLARVRRLSLEQRPFETLSLRQAAASSELRDARQLVRTIVVCESHTLEAKMHARHPEAAAWTFRLHGRSSGPLTLAVYRTPDGGAEVVIEHDTAEIESRVAATLADAFVRVLVSFGEHPFRSLAESSKLASTMPIEGPSRYSGPESVGARLSRAFAEHSARQAVVDATTKEVVSYAELHQRAQAVAAALVDLGCRPGQVVAAVANRSIDTVVAFVACELAGFVYLPLDPAYPPERTRFVLEDSYARVIVSTDPAVELPAGVRRLVPRGLPLRAFEPPTVDPEAVAYILYTSGSTGTPKGVRVPHRALVAHADAAIASFRLTRDDRVLQFASPSFDVYLEEVVPTLLVGARVVVRDEASASSPERLLTLAEREGITLLQLPTAFFHELAWDVERRKRAVPSCVRAVIIGGERVSSAACRRFRSVAPGLRLVNAYGPTEVTITSTCFDVPEVVPEVVPIGRPFGACRAYVTDLRGHVAPLGARGELVLGGPQVALGYHARDEETQRRFVPDPVDPARGVVYRTGDLVRVDESGTLTFEGRIDAQVKVRGFRIELGDVEHALESDPAVVEAAAVVLRSPAGESVLVAFVVLDDPGVSWRDVRENLAEHVPAHFVPSRIVVVDSLPRTAGGKVDRRAFAWPSEVSEYDTDVAAPSDPREAAILAIFREALGEPRLGLDDGFFDHGGTSIRALRVVARIEAALDMKPTVATLLAHPTPRTLAAWCATARPDRAEAELVRLNDVERGATPLYGVVGLHLYSGLARSLTRRPVYGIFIPEELDFPGMTLRVETLAASYLRVIEERAGDPPRLLVGFSFGALVAFEMAHQLHARGIPPDLVVMLDPRLPSMLERTRLDPLRDLLAVARRDPRRVAGFVAKKVTQKIEKVADWTTSREERHDEGPEGLSRERAYQNALELYEPKIRAYPGRAMVYVAIDESPGRIREVESRWRSLVGEGSEVVKVPGTHAVLLQEPYVSAVGSSLAAALRHRHSAIFSALNVGED